MSRIPCTILYHAFGTAIQQVHGMKTDADVLHATTAKALPPPFSEVGSKVCVNPYDMQINEELLTPSVGLGMLLQAAMVAPTLYSHRHSLHN